MPRNVLERRFRLSECRDYHQILLARPPGFVHATAILLSALLASILLWSALTRADLVVRAPGRVRAAGDELDQKSGEPIGCQVGGRVVEARVREGAVVAEGDLLLRLDGQRLENEIVRQERALAVLREELEHVVRRRELLDREHEAGRAKLAAELAGAERDQANADRQRGLRVELAELALRKAVEDEARQKDLLELRVRQATSRLDQALEEERLWTERRESTLRIAQSELEDATAEVARLERLVGSGAAAPEQLTRGRRRALEAREDLDRARRSADVLEAAARVESAREDLETAKVPLELEAAKALVREARSRLEEASLPADAARIEVLLRSLELLEAERARTVEEWGADRLAKAGEVDAAALALANVRLDLEQCTLRAHVGGTVVFLGARVGDVVEPGRPLVGIAPASGFRIDLPVPSEDVGHLAPGMEARIQLDAFDHLRYGSLRGTVLSISPDSIVAEGASSPIYLVRVALDTTEVRHGELVGRVQLGMACQVEVVTGGASVLSLFLRTIDRKISLR